MTLTPRIDAVEQSIRGLAPNLLINGGFDFWQRGTSLTLVNSSRFYLADRWFVFNNTDSPTPNSTISQQTDVPSAFGSLYSLRAQRNAGNTNTSGILVGQAIESFNLYPWRGRTMTLSFWAKAGANYSPTNSLLNARLATGTVADQNPGTTYTGEVNALNANVTLTTSWQRFGLPLTFDSNIAAAKLLFRANHTGTAGADDSFYVTGVMLTEGTQMPSYFYRSAASIAAELMACQRYCIVYGASHAVNSARFGLGQALSATSAITQVYFPVTMRGIPSISGSSVAANFRLTQNQGNAVSFSDYTTNIMTTEMAELLITGASGLAAGNVTTLMRADTTSFIRYDAEI